MRLRLTLSTQEPQTGMLICKPVVTTRCSSIHFLCWFLSDLCDLWWWSNSNENQGSRFVHAAKIRTLVWWKPVTLNENLGPTYILHHQPTHPFGMKTWSPRVSTDLNSEPLPWDENLFQKKIQGMKLGWIFGMNWWFYRVQPMRLILQHRTGSIYILYTYL